MYDLFFWNIAKDTTDTRVECFCQSNCLVKQPQQAINKLTPSCDQTSPSCRQAVKMLLSSCCRVVSCHSAITKILSTTPNSTSVHSSTNSKQATLSATVTSNRCMVNRSSSFDKARQGSDSGTINIMIGKRKHLILAHFSLPTKNMGFWRGPNILGAHGLHGEGNFPE